MNSNDLKKFLAALVLALGSSFALGSAAVAAPHPSLWRGDPLPESGVLLCRASKWDKPAPSEVPPTLRIEYSKPREWVKVTLGGQIFEKTSPLLKDGPKAWGGEIERDGWSVNVAAGPQSRGWSWFTMADDRVDWSGYCELTY